MLLQTYLETFSFTPDQLRTLWEELGNIPLNYDDESRLTYIPGVAASREEECIDENFFLWKRGERKAHIWNWFAERYPGGLEKLAFGQEDLKKQRQEIQQKAQEIREYLLADTGDSCSEQVQHFLELSNFQHELALQLVDQLFLYQPELAQSVHKALNAF